MTARVISRRGVVSATLGGIAALSVGCRDATAAVQENSLMKIAIEMDGQRLTATLFDNPSARDFATLLPLELVIVRIDNVQSMWDAINPHTGKRRIDDAFPPEVRRNMSEQEMQIEFHNGSTLQLVGSNNFDSLVGSPPVGLVFSEYALSNPTAWAYMRPILLENGGWAAFNSTPRGKNHFKEDRKSVV